MMKECDHVVNVGLIGLEGGSGPKLGVAEGFEAGDLGSPTELNEKGLLDSDDPAGGLILVLREGPPVIDLPTNGLERVACAPSLGRVSVELPGFQLDVEAREDPGHMLR
ncbi:hypothetical protein Y032_0007g3333 [Ancylostoma ceylanicum]|uniref:Uncharacterized protein n=1 Tax=Ancylostoma ceylanicum TaxID=53326 RepID=A0A016VNP6_9BILA|nr:hypothetical protein Y032_0007g3333 [Ancylostoma ceylanicum]